MLRFFHVCVLYLSLLFAYTPTFAATWVEAIGQAPIAGNKALAREQAIADAKQQAALQAAAFISSTQQISDGILEIDNLRISTQSVISNVEVIDEKRIGDRLHVRIRAEVEVSTPCSNGSSGNSFRKSVAITAFALEHPLQASRGNLRNVESQLSAILAQNLNQQAGIQALNASQLNLHPHLSTATTQQYDHGALTTMLNNTQSLEAQYIVSGVVRDLSMLDPAAANEQNWLISFYNEQDFKSDKHLRNFAVELFIHDGFSGALIEQRLYQTQGRWNFSDQEYPGFGSPAFFNSHYGEAVQKLVNKISHELKNTLRCQPFSARITQAEDNTLWINAGRNSGLNPGDKLSVYRKSTHYDPTTGQTNSELNNTRLTLTISQVHAATANGSLNGSATQSNIQPGDVVIFW